MRVAITVIFVLWGEFRRKHGRRTTSYQLSPPTKPMCSGNSTAAPNTAAQAAELLEVKLRAMVEIKIENRRLVIGGDKRRDANTRRLQMPDISKEPIHRSSDGPPRDLDRLPITYIVLPGALLLVTLLTWRLRQAASSSSRAVHLRPQRARLKLELMGG